VRVRFPSPAPRRPGVRCLDCSWPGLPGRLPDRCAREPGAPTRSYAELRLLSRPRARYQSRPGVPPSVARRFAVTSTIATMIAPARVRLSLAARGAASSMTSVTKCCRRLASRASCRVPPDVGAGPTNPILIVISSRSPEITCDAPEISVDAERRRFRSFVRASPVVGFSPLPVPASARFAGSRGGHWDELAVDMPTSRLLFVQIAALLATSPNSAVLSAQSARQGVASRAAGAGRVRR